MASAPRVLLVRHGETGLNRKEAPGASAERIRGWLDVPLDEKGRQQAKYVADRVQQWEPTRLYASDLRRAMQTARAIASATGLRVRETFDLRPWNVGKLSGELVSNAVPKMKLLTREENARPPDGEPFAEFRTRFLRCLSDLLAEARRNKTTIVAVAHTRNLQCARAWMAAGAQPSLKIDPATMNNYDDEIGTGGLMVLSPEAVAA